jgi:hypothetical protein
MYCVNLLLLIWFSCKNPLWIINIPDTYKNVGLWWFKFATQMSYPGLQPMQHQGGIPPFKPTCTIFGDPPIISGFLCELTTTALYIRVGHKHGVWRVSTKILRVSCPGFRVGFCLKIRVGYEWSPGWFFKAYPGWLRIISGLVLPIKSGLYYIRVGNKTIRLCMSTIASGFVWHTSTVQHNDITLHPGGAQKCYKRILASSTSNLYCTPYRHSVRAIISRLGSLPYNAVECCLQSGMPAEPGSQTTPTYCCACQSGRSRSRKKSNHLISY